MRTSGSSWRRRLRGPGSGDEKAVAGVLKNQRKKTLQAIGLVGLATVIFGLIASFEPFAHRYEGKTVRQWVRHFAAQPQAQVEWQKIAEFRGTNALVDRRVIAAFGTNALKPLIAEVQTSFLQGLVLEMGLRLNRSVLLHYKEDEKREAVAMLWASEWAWAAENSNDVVALLKDCRDDEFLNAVFGLCADPLTGVTCLRTYTNHADIVVRERAKLLLNRLEGE